MTHKLTPEQLKIDYINLITHSHFSIPFGIGNVKDIVKNAKKLGHKGVCLTDINSMAGCLELLKISKDKKIPIILGAELRLIDTLESKDKVNKYFNITCLVKNFTGYKNLVRLLSESGKEDHFYYKPRISLEELLNHKEGLIVTSGNMYGMISQAIIKETDQEDILVEIFKEHFGEDFYMQINYHSKNMEWKSADKDYKDIGYDPQKIVNIRLFELAKKYDVKCFITQNSFMPDEKHKPLQDILLGNSDEFKRSGFREYHSYSMKSVEQMYEDVKKMSPYITDDQFLEMCHTTIEILDKTYDLKMKFKPELPKIVYSENIVNIDPIWEQKFLEVKEVIRPISPLMLDLFEIAERDIALKTSLKVIIKNGKIDFSNPLYVNRLAEEIKIIQRNGVIQLLDYFLLLEDVTYFVVSIGKYRGFGRGCSKDSTFIHTPKDGYKSIKDIKEGDTVFTHTGSEKTVLKTLSFNTKINETLYEITVKNGMTTQVYTPDHKLYGVKRTYTNEYKNAQTEESRKKRKKFNNFEHKPDFIPIKDLKEGDALFVKYPTNRLVKDIKRIDLANYIDNEKNNISKIEDLTIFNNNGRSFNRIIDFDEDFSYMIGKWIGDGYYQYNTNKRKYFIGYCFNRKDITEITKTRNYFEHKGFIVSEQNPKSRQVTILTISNKPLTLFFKTLFKDYKSTSHTKYMGDLRFLPDNKLKQLLLGLQSADGHIGYIGTKRSENIASSSRRLIEECRESLLYLKIPSLITTRKAHIRKKYSIKDKDYLCKESYKVKFIGLSIPRKLYHNLFFDDGFYTQISSIKKVIQQTPDKVYDLIIEDDASYLTSDFVAHNSGAGSLLAYTLDITDCDPLIYTLLFERFLTKERIGKFLIDHPEYPLDGLDPLDI